MIKAIVKARIDGDQLLNVLKIPEMAKAEWRVCFEISLGNAVVTCESQEDVVEFIKVMAEKGPS